MGVTNNSIVTAPVSIADVESVIGTAGHDLGSLCKKDNINVWSRRKPIRFNKLSPLTDLDFYNSYYGFKLNTSDGFDAVFPRLEYLNSGTFSPDKLLNIHKITTYLKPRGAADSTHLVDEPYRLTDFDGYNHTANPLMYVYSIRQLFDTSKITDSWLHSLILEARNKLSPTTYPNVNGLIDVNNHLYPKDSNLLTNYVFSYTQDGSKRYRAIEISNSISFNMLIQGNERIINGELVGAPQDKFTDLYVSSLHFDDIDYNNKNLCFGIIMKFGGRYFLYKTCFPLKNIFGQNYTIVPYIDPGGNYIDTIEKQNPQILAQSNGNNFVVYIRTWLFNKLRLDIIDNKPSYQIEGNNNFFDILNIRDGDSINCKLCLYKETNSGNLTSFVEELNTINKMNELELRSCEFLYNYNMKTELNYYRVTPGRMPSSGNYVIIKNIDESVAGRPNNTFSTNVIKIKKALCQQSNNIYLYDLVNILRYVQKFNKNAGWFLMSFGSEYSQSDEFSALGGKYYTYTPILHNATHTYPQNNKIKVEMIFNFILFSEESVSGVKKGYYSNNSKIETPLSYVDTNSVCATIENAQSHSITITQYCVFDKDTNPNINYSDYGNPTEIIYNNSTIEYTINSSNVETKTPLKIGVDNFSQTSELDNFYVQLKESNFNDSYVEITVRIPDIITNEETMSNFSFKSQKLYLSDICSTIDVGDISNM